MDDLTFRIFKLSAAGFCCTQIMLKLALDDEETENDDLIRAVQGLCKGVGNSQKTCGVLSGGVAVLGLYAGKGNEREYSKENFSRMIQEYCEWFEEEFGATDCLQLIGVTKFESEDQSYQVKCGDIMVKCYIRIYEILTEYGYEYENREQLL